MSWFWDKTYVFLTSHPPFPLLPPPLPPTLQILRLGCHPDYSWQFSFVSKKTSLKTMWLYIEVKQRIRKSENQKIRKSENQKIRKSENQKIRKSENLYWKKVKRDTDKSLTWVWGEELKLNQKSYYFFYRPSLFWILSRYKKDILKKIITFFIKKLKLCLPFELEIPMERSKFKIEIFKFCLQIHKALEK
jgi:hypothetical protein